LRSIGNQLVHRNTFLFGFFVQNHLVDHLIQRRLLHRIYPLFDAIQLGGDFFVQGIHGNGFSIDDRCILRADYTSTRCQRLIGIFRILF
jgi:hypothetical protein